MKNFTPRGLMALPFLAVVALSSLGGCNFGRYTKEDAAIDEADRERRLQNQKYDEADQLKISVDELQRKKDHEVHESLAKDLRSSLSQYAALELTHQGLKENGVEQNDPRMQVVLENQKKIAANMYLVAGIVPKEMVPSDVAAFLAGK